jgi:uncharacterized protein (DUF924 family)
MSRAPIARRGGSAPGPGPEPAWVAEVLGFWFGLDEDRWWHKDPAFDAEVRARFADLHGRLAGQHDFAAATPREALAAVIALDQFPRNMFRDDPRAYATDAQARRILRRALLSGFDRALVPAERLFLYLPLQHSEDIADQGLACALTAALDNAEWLHFAEAHRGIVARFGRFPHRNAILGRTSTPGERAFLRQPRSSF